MRRAPLVALVVFGLLGLVPGVVAAAPLACPVTIMHNTTLHGDLPCPTVTSGSAVIFGKPGITLNLNGHTISGHNGSDSGIGVYTDLPNDTVIGGTIKDFGSTEVYASGATHLVVTGVHMVADAADSVPAGLYVDYGGADVVQHNTATGFYEGFDFYGSGGNLVKDNTATGGHYGIYAEYETASRWIGNHLSSNTYGLYDDYGDRNVYRANVANNNSSDGFYFDCSAYGVLQAIDNTANHNGDDGMYFSECYYDYGSTTQHSVVSRNTASQNADDGIVLDYPVQIVITGNTTNGNQNDTGLYIEDNYSLYNARLVANNIANHNNGYGIYGDYAVPPARSLNNSAGANPTQNCFNIVCR